jgi:hypothetical protein
LLALLRTVCYGGQAQSQVVLRQFLI